MKEKLQMLRNTMADIETKGDSTLRMADCLKFVAQLINECEKSELKVTPENDASIEK